MLICTLVYFLQNPLIAKDLEYSQKKEAFKLRRLLKWGIAMLKVVNDLIIDVNMPI